jgi:hypothetical protein
MDTHPQPVSTGLSSERRIDSGAVWNWWVFGVASKQPWNQFPAKS